MSDPSAIWRAAGVMSVGTALSRVTGLLKVGALTYALGVTGARLADTYNLANTTPNIVYELVLGGILTSVFVPVLVDLRRQPSGDPSALITTSLAALAIVAALVAIGAPLIMRLYTFRVADLQTRAAQLELATYLLRWFAPQIFFYGLWAIAQALLNVRNRFGPASFAPVLNNLIVTATLIAFARTMGEQGLALSGNARALLGIGTTAGVVAQAVVLIPLLRGERIRFRFNLADPAVRRVVRLAVFVVGYVVVNQIGLWVVLVLANAKAGDVTAWQVAFMFFQLPHGLFAVSLHTALSPDLARAASSGDWDSYRRGFATGVRGIAFLMLPAAVGYALLAHPIARLVLARGVADVSDADLVAGVLQVFAFGLVSFSTFHMLTRCFYAIQDTRTPTMLNAAAVGLNIAIAFPLYAAFGVRGLAAGHAIAYTAGAIGLGAMLHRKVDGGLALRSIARAAVRMALAAATMGAAVFGLMRVLPDSDALTVGVCVAAGAIIYLAFARLLRAEELSALSSLARRSQDMKTNRETRGAILNQHFCWSAALPQRHI